MFLDLGEQQNAPNTSKKFVDLTSNDQKSEGKLERNDMEHGTNRDIRLKQRCNDAVSNSNTA